MKNEVISEVLSKMLPYLNNEQSSLLKIALDGVLSRL